MKFHPAEEQLELSMEVYPHSSYCSFYESALAGCYICFAAWKFVLFHYFGNTKNEGISKIGKEIVMVPAILEHLPNYEVFGQICRQRRKQLKGKASDRPERATL